MDRYFLLTRPLKASDPSNLWKRAGTFDSFEAAFEASQVIERAETRTVAQQFSAGNATETQVVAESAMPSTVRDRSTNPQERTRIEVERIGGVDRVRALLAGRVV